MTGPGTRPTGITLSPARLARVAGVLLLCASPFASCGPGALPASRAIPPHAPNAPSAEASTEGLLEASRESDGVTFVLAPPENALREASRLSQLLSDAESLGRERIVAAHKLPFRSTLPYPPRRAHGLDRVSKSGLALGKDELKTLGRLGFVISDAKRMPTFFAGYERIYAEHLPLYVTVDSILYALHRSYDQILSTVEQGWLAPGLKDLLEGARARLAVLPHDRATKDLDVYLAVALGLLEGSS